MRTDGRRQRNAAPVWGSAGAAQHPGSAASAQKRKGATQPSGGTHETGRREARKAQLRQKNLRAHGARAPARVGRGGAAAGRAVSVAAGRPAGCGPSRAGGRRAVEMWELNGASRGETRDRCCASASRTRRGPALDPSAAVRQLRLITLPLPAGFFDAGFLLPGFFAPPAGFFAAPLEYPCRAALPPSLRSA